MRSSLAAYVTGLAIGDGNLSNPNGRATRLRITCDDKYPTLRERIASSLKRTFPHNRVSWHKRSRNCSDVSVYSNELERFLGWTAYGGPKHVQNIRVPSWVFYEKEYIRSCLRGLIETDGSIYSDRGYTFVNFTTIIHGLSQDVQIMLALLGYESSTNSSIQKSGKRKFVTRVSRNTSQFIQDLQIDKS
jgi:hypothetical protein